METKKEEIERNITVEFRSNRPFSEPLTEGTLIVEKRDVIGWYLYLIDMLINEPHKYEYFQGARIVPIFKRFGINLETLKAIEGIELRIRDLLRRRKSEADALLFEMLVALLWARNGYEVAFLEERAGGKTPDLVAKKGNQEWNIECKRQSKTSDYAYKETAKRQRMISHISKSLLQKNILLHIVFHVELETLPDTYLLDLLKNKLSLAIPGRIVSNSQVDIDFAFVDMYAIKEHLEKYSVKYNSPMLNYLIGRQSVDNKGFTVGMRANFFRVGAGDINNLYVSDIENAYGVFWTCDAKASVFAKARDIKTQINGAIQQLTSSSLAVVHIGMETFDGPEVERARFKKIESTIERIDPANSGLRWIFGHFFQAYSPPDQNWVFDETVATMSPYITPNPPISITHLIIPEDIDIEGVSHWDKPLP